MKKTILYIIAFIFLGSYYFSNITMNSSQDALNLWMNTLVPSFLFPLIIVRLLTPYHLILPLLKPFKKIIWFLFKMDLYAFELTLTSLFLGFPSASLFLDEYARNENLNKKQYQRFLYSTFLASPNFILISLRVIYNQEIVIKLFLIQLLCVFTLLLLTRNTPVQMQLKKQSISFFEQLNLSIQKSFQVLLIILAYLLLVCVIIDITTLSFSTDSKIPLKLLSEFSSGCFFIHSLSIPLSWKYLFTSFLLSYGGLCVHMQILSSVSKSHFHYLTFMKYRIFHIGLSILFTFLFLM